MKIQTDSNHKSFEVKEINKKTGKRIAQRIGVIITAVGIVITMSGCSATNKLISKSYELENKTIMEMYYNHTLSEQAMESLSINMAPIDEDFIDNLPNDLKILNLGSDNYIRDLSNLPDVCPDLEVLVIDRCYGITNFDFIQELDNLKTFEIHGENIGITEALISYLDYRGIEHNLNNDLVKIDTEIEHIVNSIIDDSMSDQEKINAITNYVLDNMSYDKSALRSVTKTEEYNKLVLSHSLEGEGVCVNYTALTSALCSKAGVESYFVNDDDHAWNLVKIEGEYYYIDTTNICQIPIISKLILEKFDKGFYYMQDPYSSSFSPMSDIDKVNAPKRLLELIDEAQDEKNFIEKYGSNAYVNLIAILGVGMGLLTITKPKRKGYRR